jgi:ATP-dependent DNA ligase
LRAAIEPPVLLQQLHRKLIAGGKDAPYRNVAIGLEGIVPKRLGSPYRSGRSKDWVKFKNPNAPAVRREAEEDWGKRR